MKTKKTYVGPVSSEVLKDPVARKAFLKQLFQKGYDRIDLPIPIEVRRDPARMMAVWRAISAGKGKAKVSLSVPPGTKEYGTFSMQTPDGVVSMPISYANMGLLKDAIAGHKVSGGNAKAYGTAEQRRKRWELYKAFMDEQITTLGCMYSVRKDEERAAEKVRRNDLHDRHYCKAPIF